MIDFVLQHWRELVGGAIGTVVATAATVPLFIPVGLLTAIARTMGPRPLQWLVIGYVDLIRGTPLLIQLFWVFYALPFVGVQLDPLPAGVLALTVHFGAYSSEVFRAGINAVPHGQVEAATVLGFGRWSILRRVVLPQGLVIAFPVIANQILEVFKATTLFSIIGAAELVTDGRHLLARTFNPTAVWLLVALFYFVVSFPVATLLRRAEGGIVARTEPTS